MTDILLLHPVASWSLDRVATVCRRQGWRLSIMTIESSTVGEHCAGLHEWIRVAALSDSPDVLRSQVGNRRYDAVVAGNEFAVVAADVLARDLGIYHNDPVAITASRNKALMRDLFARVGVGQPQVIAHLATVEDARAYEWGNVAFPVIVKPVDMAMSLFVRRCGSPEEVSSTVSRMMAFKTSRLTNYAFTAGALIEEYVDGPEFSLECVIAHGRVVAKALTRKFVSPPPACYEVGHLSGEDVPAHHEPRVVAWCEQIAAGWGMPSGVMHVEFKMTAERVSIIEAAARPAGGHIPEIVERQHGFSLEDAYLHARLGLPWTAPSTRSHGWHGIRFGFAERTPSALPGGVDVVSEEFSTDGLVAGADDFSVNRRTGYSVVRGSVHEALAEYLGAL